MVADTLGDLAEEMAKETVEEIAEMQGSYSDPVHGIALHLMTDEKLCHAFQSSGNECSARSWLTHRSMDPDPRSGSEQGYDSNES